MPQRITAEHIEFLDALHAWIGRGLPAYTFAQERKTSSGTITYRLNHYGLKARRAVGLVDKRTGILWPELRDSGEFTLAPDPEPETAVA